MSKFVSATALLQAFPLETLGDSLCCVTKDAPRWVRLTHRTFTLDLRIDANGVPQLVAPFHQISEPERLLLIGALEGAVRDVSDGEIGLAALMASLQSEPCGRDVLRCLMPLRVVQGGRIKPAGKNPNPPLLRVA